MLQIKCKNCKTWNTDVDYCTNCNAVISMEEEARLEDEVHRIKIENQPDSKIDKLIKKYKNHPNFIIRGIFYIFYSVYFIVMSIGAFMAWLTLMSQA